MLFYLGLGAWVNGRTGARLAADYADRHRSEKSSSQKIRINDEERTSIMRSEIDRGVDAKPLLIAAETNRPASNVKAV